MANLLSDTIDEYLVARRAAGYRPNTVRNDDFNLRQLLALVGNIQVKNVTSRHIDSFMAEGAGRGLSATTLNLRLATVHGFFRHCIQRRYVASNNDPTANRRAYREAKRIRLRVPVVDFGRLLDSAPDARDRIVVALGLYLLLRESEIRLLRVRDVGLAAGSMDVMVPKSAKSDTMPICTELDAELRRWLTYYSSHVRRSLKPTDALAPAWERAQIQRQPDGLYRVQSSAMLEPDHPYSTPHRSVQAALVACGFATHDADGKSLREGVHTLRRSAARARFDALSEMGVDRALRHVQAMLHHSQISTTELYIGLDADRTARDTMLRGEVMFPAAVKAAAIRKVVG
jgi:site-specific recombinase XerC